MNDPVVMVWLTIARQAKACDQRLAKYEAKAAQGTLKITDVEPQDALWIFSMVKTPEERQALKVIASKSPATARLIEKL